jgi:hypothetical protein
VGDADDSDDLSKLDQFVKRLRGGGTGSNPVGAAQRWLQTPPKIRLHKMTFGSRIVTLLVGVADSIEKRGSNGF